MASSSRCASARLWLCALALGCCASSARAQQPRERHHDLSLAVGVPVPLRVYGDDASLRGTGVDLELLLHGRLAYTLQPSTRVRPLVLGARASIAAVRLGDGQLSLWGWAALGGPLLGARWPLSFAPRWAASIGAGPALARSGFRIDAELRRDFWAPGLFGFAQLTVALRSVWQLALEIAVEHVFPAPADAAFFNQQLGSTTLLAFSLGAGVRL